MDIAVVVISDGVGHQAPRPIKEAMDIAVVVISGLPDLALLLMDLPMVVE
jgi:hypothetical protein